MDVILYVLLGLAFVAALTHATGFATAVGSVGGVITSESQILSGSTAGSTKAG